MCDIVWIPCEECSKGLEVHIGDFCTPSENVLVRCQNHPPPPDGLQWVVFRGVSDYESVLWGSTDLKNAELGDWWMALKCELDNGYGVGEAGDIVPNCDWDKEEPWPHLPSS